MAFNATDFMQGLRSEEYVEKIDLRGRAEAADPAFISRMIDSRLSFLRPRFNMMRQAAGMGVGRRLGETTLTGQRTTAYNQTGQQIAGMVGSEVMQVEQEAEAMRQRDESAYLGYLNWKDNMEFQARTAEEELRRMEEQNKFGWGDAFAVASMFV